MSGTRLHTRPGLPPAHRRAGAPALHPARGAASLIVVMVLFFMISLVAAYTSRNLVFEQRTSANQYRATLAFEAADAGIEWALARLNEGRMDDDCVQLALGAVTPGTPEPSFRERYLTVDPGTGVITPVADLLAGCVFDGSTWSCACPAAGEPAPAFTANGDGPYVAFWVRFVPIAGRPGVVRVESNGCTRNDAACLRFNREAQTGDGLATVYAVLALRNALGTPPDAPLIVRGAATVTGSLTVTNDDAAADGTTVHAGAAFPWSGGGVTLRSLPGTPAERSVIQDDEAIALPDLSPALSPATPANNGVDRMFASVFGMWQSTYAEQPGVVLVDCSGGCSASDVNDAMLLHPGHAIYAQGAGPVTIDADVGSATDPVVLVADGNVVFGGTTPTLYGVAYSRAATWATSGTGNVRGALIAERALTVAGTHSLTYDAALLTRLRATTGSYVKVPGSWRDFAPLP